MAKTLSQRIKDEIEQQKSIKKDFTNDKNALSGMQQLEYLQDNVSPKIDPSNIRSVQEAYGKAMGFGPDQTPELVVSDVFPRNIEKSPGDIVLGFASMDPWGTLRRAERYGDQGIPLEPTGYYNPNGVIGLKVDSSKYSPYEMLHVLKHEMEHKRNQLLGAPPWAWLGKHSTPGEPSLDDMPKYRAPDDAHGPIGFDAFYGGHTYLNPYYHDATERNPWESLPIEPAKKVSPWDGLEEKVQERLRERESLR